jgi:DNA-binding MurR/RpiR family transcriptional regulator
MPETTVDVEALYAALDRRRQNDQLSWRTLASKLEITPSTFTRMAQGLKPDVDTFATLIRWLGMSQEEFLLPSKRRTKEADPVAMISSYLRGAKNISQQQAEALEDIIGAAYKHLVKEQK